MKRQNFYQLVLYSNDSRLKQLVVWLNTLPLPAIKNHQTKTGTLSKHDLDTICKNELGIETQLLNITSIAFTVFEERKLRRRLLDRIFSRSL